MKRYTFTILEEHRAQLRELVLSDTDEAGAILLCGRSAHIDPWSGQQEERFLCREVIAIPESAYLERTPTQMTWSTTPFYETLKRSERRGDAVAIVHSHPEGPLHFSARDDVADRETFEIAFMRLESDRPHLSIIMGRDGDLIARAYEGDLKAHDVDLIRIVGERWDVRYAMRANGAVDAELDRQVRAFGAAATRDLGQLRIGIAGCGGTGSAVAMLLARMGARRLAFFDTDYVDETSLNRLHFSTRADAGLRESKVDVVARGVASLGLPVSIIRIKEPVDSPAAQDALRACDVVFGCTDDHLGRNLLNRLAHFYLIPVIDLGLLIEPTNGGGYDVFDGRVTVVQPGYPCQVCRKLINAEVMHAESMRRNDPVLYAHYRRAGYVPSGADPSPVVVSFTTEVATMAVDELLQRLTGFRGPGGSCAERVRRFDEAKDSDSTPAGLPRLGCKLCDRRKYDGRGDMRPYLDQSS
jgi:molybdopterin/thiamine biosynthesis adenylyltransferase